MLALRAVSRTAPGLSRSIGSKATKGRRQRRAASAALARLRSNEVVQPAAAPEGEVPANAITAKVAIPQNGSREIDIKGKWDPSRVAERQVHPRQSLKAGEKYRLRIKDELADKGDEPAAKAENEQAASGSQDGADTNTKSSEGKGRKVIRSSGDRPTLDTPPHFARTHNFPLEPKDGERGEEGKGPSKELKKAKKKERREEPPRDEFLELFRPDDEAKAASEAYEPVASGMLAPSDVPIRGVKSPREAKVARLARGLQRVLFAPGVHSLRDPRTGVWNFEPELAEVPEPEQFAFHRMPQYITASKDDELAQMAEGDGLRFIGSTSTLTQALSQIYFTLSGGRGVDHTTLSGEFSSERKDFTAGAQLPALLNIELLPNGRYAIDNDKSNAIDENILSDYGRILEKLLTAEKDDFERFLTSSPESAVPESERTEREAYCYSRSSSLLMRSQLDCQDDRLPGNGTFDIKTRACMPIRMDRANYKKNSDYDISTLQGYKESFEREYYDLTRSGMLKYSLQARIGQMDGIFVAYHNTVRCFGFQYLPLSELDERLFGSTEIANQVFHLCVGLLERILEKATEIFPDRSLSMTLHRTKPRATEHDFENELIVTFAPTTWDNPDTPIPRRAMSIKLKAELDGTLIEGGVLELSGDRVARREQKLKVQWDMGMTPDTVDGIATATTLRDKAITTVRAMNSLSVPDGETPFKMLQATRKKYEGQVRNTAEVRWVAPNERTVALRQEAQESGKAYRKRVESWSAAKDGMWWGAESQRPGANGAEASK
ncbi:mRNA degradation protein, mitochondrial [Vanrija pseudolonga]|uniref:mRNA degradation protein, mitochondrial n=1 Tax=Vanrija pseudolonga TaxID=143232 RepID=A0AAF0YF12_9TREE|nr:mRNA degradation protein, mitochondrial [Vanrija pseudolonga]